MRTQWGLWLVGLWLIEMPLSVAAKQLPSPPFTLPHSADGLPARDASPEDALDALARTYGEPKAVAAFLKTTLTFRRDEELFGEADHWQSPEEFLARKVGDCEDYALLARALLRRRGITAHVLSLFGQEGYAHTVCVFLDAQGRYNVIDVDRARFPRAKTLEALASWLYPGWTFGGLVDQDGARGRMLQRITNPHPAPGVSAIDPISSPLASF